METVAVRWDGVNWKTNKSTPNGRFHLSISCPVKGSIKLTSLLSEFGGAENRRIGLVVAFEMVGDEFNFV